MARALRSASVLVLTLAACAPEPARRMPVPDAPREAAAPPAANAPAAVTPPADAAAPPASAAEPVDAGRAAPRPVVIHAFRRVTGSADAVSPRAPKPDGEPDAVFELVVEGDVKGLALWNANASLSAVALIATPPPPPATTTTPLPVPGPQKRPAWGLTKHAPALYVFEGAALVSDEEGHLALPEGRGKRTLRLYTWRPLDGGGKGPWRLLVLAEDGRDREAPSLP